MPREKQQQKSTPSEKPPQIPTNSDNLQTPNILAGPATEQVARLYDARMPTAQRQAHAGQVGKVTGNNYLQRLIRTSNPATTGISRQIQPNIQRQTQTKETTEGPSPDYHIAIDQSGRAFLVANPQSLKDDSFTKAKHPASNAIGKNDKNTATDNTMNTYTRGSWINPAGGVEEVGQDDLWYTNPSQDMYGSFNTETAQDKAIDIYIYKEYKEKTKMSSVWKQIAHVTLSSKAQGNVHEVIKQLSSDQLSQDDLSKVIPFLHTIPGVGTKNTYTNEEMIQDARSAGTVAGLPEGVRENKKVIPADGKRKARTIDLPGIGSNPDDRYEFMQYMRAVLGSEEKVVAHFNNIREVKGTSNIYLHNDAATQLEQIMAYFESNGWQFPTVTCGFGLRNRFRVNKPFGKGMMMHPMGYSLDLYALHNPYIHKTVKRDGKKVPNEVKEFTDVMAQELNAGGNAGPANLRLKNAQVMVQKLASGEASAKEKSAFLDQLQSELTRLAQASASFQRLISVKARADLKVMRTEYLKERKRWISATKEQKTALDKKQREQKKLEQSKAVWEKKKDSDTKTKKLEEIQAKLDQVAQEIAAITQKMAEIAAEQQTYEANIKPHLTELLQPVTNTLASAKKKLEYDEEEISETNQATSEKPTGTTDEYKPQTLVRIGQGDMVRWVSVDDPKTVPQKEQDPPPAKKGKRNALADLSDAKERLAKLQEQRTRIENYQDLPTLPSREISHLDYNAEDGTTQAINKPGQAPKTMEERLAVIDREIELAKQKVADADASAKKHTNRAAWDRISKLEEMLTTDMNFVLVGEADHINPSIAGLLINGFFTIGETAMDQEVTGPEGEKTVKKGLISEGYLDKDWHVQNIEGFNIEFFKQMALHGFVPAASWDSPDAMHFDYAAGRDSLPNDIEDRVKKIRHKVPK